MSIFIFFESVRVLFGDPFSLWVSLTFHHNKIVFKGFSEVCSQIRWQNNGVHKKIVFTSKCYFGVFFWSTLWCFVLPAYWKNLFEKRIWKKIFLNFDEQKAKLTKVGSKSAPLLSRAPDLPRLYVYHHQRRVDKSSDHCNLINNTYMMHIYSEVIENSINLSMILFEKQHVEKIALSQNLIWKFWLNRGRHFATLQFVLFFG